MPEGCVGTQSAHLHSSGPGLREREGDGWGQGGREEEGGGKPRQRDPHPTHHSLNGGERGNFSKQQGKHEPHGKGRTAQSAPGAPGATGPGGHPHSAEGKTRGS